MLFLLLWVNDIFISIQYRIELEKLKEKLNLESRKANIRDGYIEGSNCWILSLSQHRYLEKFRIHESEHIGTPLAHHTKLSVIHMLMEYETSCIG